MVVRIVVCFGRVCVVCGVWCGVCVCGVCGVCGVWCVVCVCVVCGVVGGGRLGWVYGLRVVACGGCGWVYRRIVGGGTHMYDSGDAC